MILAVCPFFLPLLSVMSALPLRAPTRADRLRPLRCHKAWVDTGLAEITHTTSELSRARFCSLPRSGVAIGVASSSRIRDCGVLSLLPPVSNMY